MTAVPRRKEEPNESTRKIENLIIACIDILNQIQRYVSGGMSELSDNVLADYHISVLDSYFHLYREADQLLQEQEGLELLDNYPVTNWKRRMEDLRKHLEKRPSVIDEILILISRRFSMVRNEAVPIITLEDIHYAITISIIDDAGELYPLGYFQKFIEEKPVGAKKDH